MRRAAAAATLLIIAVLGCNTDDLISPESPHFAKGGRGKPGKVVGTPLIWSFQDASPSAIVSDGFGPYVHEECGVRAWFPGEHDAVLDPDWKPIKRDKNCPITSVSNRHVMVTPPGMSAEEGGGLNVNDIWDVSGTNLRDAVIHTPRGSYRFGFGLGGDQVRVTRSGEDTWIVETVSGHLAYSTTDDELYPLPLKVTITLR
jgi:hypothetical protein